jgi:superoxide dismutase
MMTHVFTMHNNRPLIKMVELCGSFDGWKTRFPMQFDVYNKKWFTTMHLTRGKYLYKYLVNSINWVVNE